MKNFWKSWNNKFKTRNNKINVEGSSIGSAIAAEFAKYFVNINTMQESDFISNSRDMLVQLC